MSEPSHPERALPRVVIALGAVTLLSDVASEMIYPLLPTLLRGLGGGAVSLGAVEGVGDAAAALCKYVAGRLADDAARRRPLVLFGYGVSALARPALAIVFAPWQVVLSRFVDRIGKGVRASPRDALLAASTARARAGAAFGFHRAMDNVGATVGPLLVSGLLALFAGDTQKVVLFAAVPGLASVLTLWLFVREPRGVVRAEGGPLPDSDAGFTADRRAIRDYFVVLGFFAVVNTSDLFLLRRLAELGASSRTQALAWALLNGVRALAGYPGGRLSDRLGRAPTMMIGWLLYAATYGAMARASSLDGFLPAMAIYGLFYGCTEGAERALLASLVPRRTLGSTFGVFHIVVGLAMLPSNLLFGFAWDRVGGPTCLALSAAGAMVAFAGLGLWTKRHGATRR